PALAGTRRRRNRDPAATARRARAPPLRCPRPRGRSRSCRGGRPIPGRAPAARRRGTRRRRGPSSLDQLLVVLLDALLALRPLLRPPHPVLRFLQHLLVLGSEDGNALADFGKILARPLQLLGDVALRLLLLPQLLEILGRDALAVPREHLLERLRDVLHRGHRAG